MIARSREGQKKKKKGKDGRKADREVYLIFNQLFHLIMPTTVYMESGWAF